MIAYKLINRELSLKRRLNVYLNCCRACDHCFGFIFTFMKMMLKVMLAILILSVVGLLIMKSVTQKTQETFHNPELSLYVAADSANMLRATSVGLGKHERHRVISGRLYRNFVQLLKTNGNLNERDTFAVACETGLDLEFYRDTVLLGKFRMTDRIGRDSTAGVWKTRHMAKVNKFLKDQAVQFMACKSESSEDSAVEEFLPGEKNQRTILTMPKFGASLKSKRNAEREQARDSVAGAAAELSRLDSTVIGESQNALKILDELILPSDTAVGVPLSIRFDRMKNGSVSFYNDDGSERRDAFVALTKKQMEELGMLLSHTRLETFAMSRSEERKKYSQITLIGENDKVVRLWSVSEKPNYLVKYHKGDRFSNFEGYWVPEDPTALQAFFSGLK